jgi:hypothetical protein
VFQSKRLPNQEPVLEYVGSNRTDGQHVALWDRLREKHRHELIPAWAKEEGSAAKED